MSEKRIPKVTATCRCKRVKLEVSEIKPQFTACHCSTCQLLHSGPGFGVACNNVKIKEGADVVKSINPSGWATWHFCGNCGTRLHYIFEEKLWKNRDNRFVVSAGLLNASGAPGLQMEKEVTYDAKPPYYCFAGNREHLTTSETYALYAFDSQKSSG
jgi:hypothetical protein